MPARGRGFRPAFREKEQSSPPLPILPRRRDPRAVPAAFDPIFGDLSHEREMRENQVKGNLLGRRAWYVRDRWGDAVLAEIAAAVPRAARTYLVDTPLTFAWYPFGAMMDIDRAILEGPMHGEIERMIEFGSAIAKHDLPTLYKVLFNIGSPAAILKRINVVTRQYIRRSPMRTEIARPGHALITLGGHPFPLYFCAYGCTGWVLAALELSGAKSPKVTHPSCVHRGDAACAWQAEWG
jgi:hypothetical protein